MEIKLKYDKSKTIEIKKKYLNKIIHVYEREQTETSGS